MSRVRYFVVFVSMLMAVLLYLDRFCVSFAADYIREDLDLSQNDVAWMFSIFFWSYALAQVPSGWLSDRYCGANNIVQPRRTIGTVKGQGIEALGAHGLLVFG